MIPPHDCDRPVDTYLRLSDGSVCRIRPSGPDDRPLVRDCFDALSPDSRRLRFFAAKEALTPGELERFSAVDGSDHIAMAALRIDETGRELAPLGFARCMRLAPGSESAELSIAVADGAQGQGLGSALLARLIQAARAQGIRRFRCEVLAENLGMRRLARTLGGDPQWLGNGVLDYDCPLPEPAPSAAAPGPGPDPVPRSAPATPSQRAPEPPAPTPVPPGAGRPWYLHPSAWLAAGMDAGRDAGLVAWGSPWGTLGALAWAAHLDRCRAWIRASNDDRHPWLGPDLAQPPRPDRTAA